MSVTKRETSNGSDKEYRATSRAVPVTLHRRDSLVAAASLELRHFADIHHLAAGLPVLMRQANILTVLPTRIAPYEVDKHSTALTVC
jgi:hypothetical protein